MQQMGFGMGMLPPLVPSQPQEQPDPGPLQPPPPGGGLSGGLMSQLGGGEVAP